MRYVQITIEEFDNLCKSEKGWIRNTSGYEYVYDYRVPKTNVMIKIMSSIDVNGGLSRNRGADAIRVFAVLLDENGKVVRGLLKAHNVYRVTEWKEHTIQAFKEVRTKALYVAKKNNLLTSTDDGNF